MMARCVASRSTGGEQPLAQPCNSVRILGVHHDHRALAAREFEHVEYLTIRQLEVVVRHVQLEGRIPGANERGQLFFQDPRRRIGDDEVERVVDAGLAVRAAVIVLDRCPQRAALDLRRERDDGRRAATGGRPGAGLEVVGHLHRLRHRLIEVAVAIHPPREYVTACGVDLAVRRGQVGRKRGDLPGSHADVASVKVARGDRDSVADDQVELAHGACLAHFPEQPAPAPDTPGVDTRDAERFP